MDANAGYTELLPYIDYKEGLQRVMNSKNLYHRLLKSFKDGSLVSALLTALQANDLKEMERAAHTVKGTAANLGLKELFELSLALETEIKGGAKPQSTSAFEEAAEKTAAAIDRLLEE